MIINVVGAKKYDFKDQKTGKQIKGINLFYTAKNSFDDYLIGKISGKIGLGEKAADTLDVYNLIKAHHCIADFDNNGKLLSLEPVFTDQDQQQKF